MMGMVNDTKNKPLRLGGLLSGGGRTLLNIHEEIQAGRLNAEIVTVVASRPCKGVQRCREAGLPVEIIPFKDMPDDQTYWDRITANLDQAQVDLVCMAGFLSFWKIPDHYAGRVMNIHPALLPLFGGKGLYGDRVHQAVLASGTNVSGCTVHFVNNEYDAGPIIVQREVEVLDTDTPETLAARVFEQECIAYPMAIRLFSEGKISTDGQIVQSLE